MVAVSVEKYWGALEEPTMFFPHLYAFWSDAAGVMKFGCSARYPLARLRQIKRKFPDAEIFGAVSMARRFRWERCVHEALAQWRAYGEWFRLTPEVARMAMAIRSKDAEQVVAEIKRHGVRIPGDPDPRFANCTRRYQRLAVGV